MEEARRIGKAVDLFAFLLLKHPEEVEREGKSLRLKDYHNISLLPGWVGYKDFKNNDSGNGYKLLITYLGYTAEQAVEELQNFSLPEGFYESLEKNPKVKAEFVEPEHFINNDRCRDYLCGKRYISPDIVGVLIDRGLLYQSQYGYCPNLVFLNREKDYAEIHGTLNKSYKRKVEGSKEGGFWWFSPVEDYLLDTVQKVYVCEAAIDSISLYQLLMERAIYVSIGGARCQSAIDRIKSFLGVGKEIIIAVDNDIQGQNCRDANKDLKYIIPKSKDWNEDLKNDLKKRYVK